MRSISRFILLTLLGWRIKGTFEPINQCVVIAAPHTSNWDFALLLLVAFVLKIDMHWMGKDTLFPWYHFSHLESLPICGIAAALPPVPKCLLPETVQT